MRNKSTEISIFVCQSRKQILGIFIFFFQAEDGIRDTSVTGVQTCALPIYKPDLTVVGPDNPLALGIVDDFKSHGLRIWGPNQQAAQFESSKVFSQRFMQRYGRSEERRVGKEGGRVQARAAFVVKMNGVMMW